MPDTLDHLLTALREVDRALTVVREDLARHDERHKHHDERYAALLKKLDGMAEELGKVREELGDEVNDNTDRIVRWQYGVGAVAGFLTLLAMLTKGVDALRAVWGWLFG